MHKRPALGALLTTGLRLSLTGLGYGDLKLATAVGLGAGWLAR